MIAASEARVAVVDNVLTWHHDEPTHECAKRIVSALDAYDAALHVRDQRGQMSWEDETE